MSGWLTLRVGCAECMEWNGNPLVEVLGRYASLDEAKSAHDENSGRRGWQEREGGGVYNHGGSGGIEIVPIPEPKP